MTRPVPDLWDWAVAFYAKPGVASALLDLQDGCGADVCLILWALHRQALGGPALSEDAVKAACACAAGWSDAVVSPLRRVRRAAKARLRAAGGAEGAAYAALKAAEIACERVTLERLAALAPGREPAEGRGPETSPRDDLALLFQVAGWRTPTAGAFDLLVRAMSA